MNPSLLIGTRKISGLDRLGTIEAAMDANSKLFAQQLIIIRTRVDAIEQTLFGSRIAMIWALIVAIISPKMMAEKMKRTHQKMMDAFNEVQKKQGASITRVQGAAPNDLKKPD